MCVFLRSHRLDFLPNYVYFKKGLPNTLEFRTEMYDTKVWFQNIFL